MDPTTKTGDRRGPAGDGFLALVHGLGPVLEIVKGVIASREARIDWDADDFLRERDRLEPLIEAYKIGKASYERLTAHGPEVVDGAVRLLTALKLTGFQARVMVADETSPLERALRALTEQSKEDANVRGTVDGV